MDPGPAIHDANVADQRTARSRLVAAHLGGVTATAILAQFVLDMPGGYFGTAEEITTFGWIYTAVSALGAAFAVHAVLKDRRWASAARFLLSTLHLGIFLTPLASDPVVAGVVVGWNVLLLGDLALWLPPRVVLQAPTWDSLDPLARWERLNGSAARVLLATSVATAVAVAGYRIGHHLPAQVVCVLLGIAAIGITIRLPWLLMRHASRVAALLPLPLVAILLQFLVVSPGVRIDAMLGLATLYQGTLLAVLVGRTPLAAELMRHFVDRPAHLLLASFAALIGVGTLLLSFPAASCSGQAIAPLDALFTSTSAACVTGLVVLDTGGDFSLFGQVVILALIQVGGLNIMVLSGFALVVLGQRLGLRGEAALGEILDAPQARSARQIVMFIVVSTVVIEAVGALALWGSFRHGDAALGSALWNGVFHSVSAYCNAGFALQPDSLVGHRSDPLPLAVIAALIVLGGLGFPVLHAAWGMIGQRSWRPSTVHVRLVLGATAALLLIGALWFGVAEWGGSLAGLSPGDKLVNAAFQSTTLRTAGFNSIDLAQSRPVTRLLAMVWMFVGASPGSTGGGIKTTTLVVLLGVIAAITRNDSRVVVLRRTVSLETVYRSAAIVTIYTLVAALGAVALLATQRQPLDVLLFEVASAIGTVGLSLGATQELDGLGKLVIIGLMFIGRVGPLTLVLLMGRTVASGVRYPESPIIVG